MNSSYDQQLQQSLTHAQLPLFYLYFPTLTTPAVLISSKPLILFYHNSKTCLLKIRTLQHIAMSNFKITSNSLISPNFIRGRFDMARLLRLVLAENFVVCTLIPALCCGESVLTSQVVAVQLRYSLIEIKSHSNCYIHVQVEIHLNSKLFFDSPSLYFLLVQIMKNQILFTIPCL